jgi:hypothetical protein
VYVFGSDSYAHKGVAHELARIVDERIRAIPTAPVAAEDLVYSVSPRQIALGVGEVGKEVDTIVDREGADDRAQWYESRFTRPPARISSHIGPLDMYSKVWVARDVELAKQIYGEQAKPNYFPEARQELGDGQFPMENLPAFGNDNFGFTACNDNCGTRQFNFLHQRYVWRIGNVVAIIYIWGGTQESHVNQVSTYARSMLDRLK